MNLDELRALITVVDTGSMVSAARQLRYPRATLRRRLDELEARVGVPLLVRSPSGVVATPAGDVLVRSSKLLLQQAGTIFSQVRDIGAEPAGTIRVLFASGLPVEPIVLILREMQSHPRLQLKLDFSVNPLLGSMDEVDLIFHFGEMIPDGPWLSYRLYRLRECLMATDEYLAERGTPCTLEDLAQHDIFAWSSPEHAADRLALANGSEWQIVPRVQSADVHALRRLASMNMGLAYVPDSGGSVPGDPTNNLRPVMSDIVGRDTALRLLVPAPLIELPKIRIAMDLVKAFFGSIVPDRRGVPASSDDE